MPPEGFQWDSENIARVLKILKDNIKRMPEDEAGSIEMLAEIYGWDMDAVREAQGEAKVEYEANRDLIDSDDVVQFFEEAYKMWVNDFTSLTGNVPTDYERKQAAFFIQTFMMNDDPNAAVFMAGPDIENRNYPQWEISEMADQTAIMNALDPVLDEKRFSANQQPLYFTEELQLRAFMRAAQVMLPNDIYGPANRADPRIWEQVRSRWPNIWTDLQRRGIAANPALETMSRRVLLEAQGLEGSRDDQIDLGYITTLFTDDPITKEEYREQEIAREAIQDVSEEQVNKIVTNPSTWLGEYYRNPRNFPDFARPESAEAKARLNEWIKDRSYDIEAYVNELRMATTGTGSLRYSPDDIARMVQAQARTYVNSAPNIREIDAQVAQEELTEEAEAERTARLGKITTPELARTAASNWVKDAIRFNAVMTEQGIDNLGTLVWNEYQSARETGEPLPSVEEILRPFLGAAEQYVRRKEEETALEESKKALDARRTALGKIKQPGEATTAVNNFIEKYFGIGKDIPEYAKNEMATGVFDAYNAALQAGVPVPESIFSGDSRDAVLERFLPLIPSLINRNETDTEEVAKGLLGITDFTTKEVVENLSDATASLKERIESGMEMNPWSGDTAADIGADVLQNFGVNTFGQLAPFPGFTFTPRFEMVELPPAELPVEPDAVMAQEQMDIAPPAVPALPPMEGQDTGLYLGGPPVSAQMPGEPGFEVRMIEPEVPRFVENMERWRRGLTGEEALDPNMPASVWEGTGLSPFPSFGYGAARPVRPAYTRAQVESAFLPQYAQRPEMYSYMQKLIPQLTSGIQGAPAGTTLSEFADIQLPVIEQSFGQTPMFYQEQARMEREAEQTMAAERSAESQRRGALRGGTSIFRRRTA